MLFQWIVLIATCLGSIFLKSILNRRTRVFLMPWCIAYTLAVIATVGSIGGFLHFFFMVLNYVIIMVLCNGFSSEETRFNPAWKSFLLFYAYMFGAVFFGLYPLQGACSYLMALVSTFYVGFSLATWVCRQEGALDRLTFTVTIAGLVVCFYSIIHGGLSVSALDANGRGGLDINTFEEGVKQNVNYLALTLDMLLPFLTLAVVHQCNTKKTMLRLIMAVAALVVVTLMLIRTGARNGALGLFPCIWYFISSKNKRFSKGQKILGGIVIALILATGVSITMKGSGHLRAFSFFSNDTFQSQFQDKADYLTSGRISMYRNLYDLMSPVQRIFGAGYSVVNSDWVFDKELGMEVRQTRISAGNAHSMYVQVFMRSGWLGVALFLVFILKTFVQGRRLGERGKIGLMFFGVWLMTGVGEAWGMAGGSISILAGFGVGMLTLGRVNNSEVMDSDACRLYRSFFY